LSLSEISICSNNNILTLQVAASGANVIITMLPSSPHVRSVYLNDSNPIIEGARAGQVFIFNYINWLR
jgi:3-hydroxyisobutyrate dehydrogenase-like beta-hydroxyacid dehydrogenase